VATGQAVRLSRLLNMLVLRNWWQRRDLNPRPTGYEPVELPDCSTLLPVDIARFVVLSNPNVCEPTEPICSTEPRANLATVRLGARELHRL
jgi:hypothetical protein